MFQVEMARPADEEFGMELEAELVDDAETEDELKVIISHVEDGSPALRAGILAGDELLTLNGEVRMSDLGNLTRDVSVLVRSTIIVSNWYPKLSVLSWSQLALGVSVCLSVCSLEGRIVMLQLV